MKQPVEISEIDSLLVYKEGYTPEFVRQLIQDHSLRGLKIFSHLKDDRIPDIAFLCHYGFLESLSISSIDDYDYGVLSELTMLRDLSITSPGSNVIDLRAQTNLEQLTLYWRKGRIHGLDQCQHLRDICLVEFSEEDLEQVSCLANLHRLRIKTSTIRNTTGISRISGLRVLQLANCKRLQSLDEVQHLSMLEEVEINTCPRIHDYSVLSTLISMKKLLLIDCKRIETLQFIEKLVHLTELHILGNSDVVDGDLSYATRIPNVVYRHRKHYNIVIVNKETDLRTAANMQKLKETFHR